jgi:hypothetical protein
MCAPVNGLKLHLAAHIAEEDFPLAITGAGCGRLFS